MRLSHLDLCTGIGGFHIAAEWAGFETMGFSEVDPYCCKLLAEKWPGIKNYGDLRTADFSGLGGIGVLSGGIPCQPASLAGKGLGAADDRWLWPEACSVVESIKPYWLIFENPSGILRVDAFQSILLRLETAGYELAPPIHVPANSIGADHYRFRVFIVANLTGERRNRGGRGQSEYVVSAETQTHRRWSEAERLCAPVCHTNGPGLAQRQSEQSDDGPQFPSAVRANRPEFNPELLRAVHGVRNRRDRIKALGNAVVPQQAYPFFRAIAQTESELA